MKSKWYNLKRTAIQLREKGFSIRKIEQQLKIPRSTLSGWLRNIELTQHQKRKLFQEWKSALVQARKKAVLWHNAQKERRLEEAKEHAVRTLENIDISNAHILELALAMLYLGEGSKKADETSMGNADPLVLKTFISILKNVYHADITKFRCDLYLRADQNPSRMKKFWAMELGIPAKNFKYVHSDNRTQGSPTYPHYKGVCTVRYGDVAIKRKLLNISNGFCERLIFQRP